MAIRTDRGTECQINSNVPTPGKDPVNGPATIPINPGTCRQINNSKPTHNAEGAVDKGAIPMKCGNLRRTNVALPMGDRHRSMADSLL